MDSKLLERAKKIEYKLCQCNSCLEERVIRFTAEKWRKLSYGTFYEDLPKELNDDIKAVIVKWRDKFKSQLESL